MPFDQNNLPEWNVEGVEPPQSKKDSGWGPGEKPPADWFNWFFSKTYNALKSLFDNAQHKEEKGQPNGYASLDSNGKVPSNQISITKDQVGLGNVDNVKQAAKTDFDAHNNDNVRHVTQADKDKWNAMLPAANYTAADVLNKIKTVDGSGSGLDADTLDGKDSSAFAQSAFANVKVGSTTVASDSPTDTLELVAGSNVTLTPDSTNDKVTISANVPVSSVNGKTGAVNLTPADVGAAPATHSHAIADVTGLQSALDGKASTATATTTTNGLMSASDKSKLDGIAAGAEVNQNSFANVKVGATTIAADSETDTLELVAGSNITLTPDATNDKVTIAANVPVSSVNGKTGAVSLTASDVGAETPSGAQAKVDALKTLLNGYGIGSNAPIITDANAVTATGFYQPASNATNVPTTSGSLLHLQRDGARPSQIYIDYQTNIMYFRSYTSGGWTAWATVETASGAQTKANTAETNAKSYADGKFLPSASYTASDVLTKLKTVDGSGSGLDADLLDGKQVSDLVLQTEKGAANGVATLDANTKVPVSQLPSASTSGQGVVQLVDSTSSTSTTKAPTANAVKQANDNANSRVSKSGDTMTGRLQFGAGQDIAQDTTSGTTPSQGIRFSGDTDIFDLFLRTDNSAEKSGLILQLGDNSDDYFQIEQVSPGGEATPTKLFKISETEGANFLVQLKQNGSQVETTSGAQAKANTAESNAKAYTDIAPEAMQRNFGQFLTYRSGKDSNGVFTTVDYKRSNGTLFARSVLSNADTNGNYQTRTITYYAADGSTVVRTDTWTLTYDADGDLVNEVKA